MEGQKIIRRYQVQEMINVSSGTLRRLEKNGDFPKRIQLSPGSVGYLLNEIDDWLKKRMSIN